MCASLYVSGEGFACKGAFVDVLACVQLCVCVCVCVCVYIHACEWERLLGLNTEELPGTDYFCPTN